jgi:cytochrome c1
MLFAIVALLTNCDKCTNTINTDQEASTAVKLKAINKGIGPIKNVTLGVLDNDQAQKGNKIFTLKCSACHKIEKRYIGPALGGITRRRSPEWIMNMIMNPEEMIKKDPDAKKLFEEFLAPMANQNITSEEARALLEFFRKNDA